MIDINLVPPSLRKRSSSGVLANFPLDIPREIILGVGVGCIVLLLAIHVVLFAILAVKGSILAVHNSAWQSVAADKNKIDAFGTEIKDLKKKMTGITDLTAPKGLGWSQKLNIISDALANGIWLNKVAIEAKALTIEGSVLARNQNEVTAVGGFVAELKKNEFFMRDLTGIEVNSVQRGKKGNIDTADFKITAKFK